MILSSPHTIIINYLQEMDSIDVVFFQSYRNIFLSISKPLHPQKYAHFTIIIIGAGIASLGAALSLRRAGYEVVVLKRQAEFQALGGPLHLAPNSARVLTAWGMGDIMDKANNSVVVFNQR